MKDYRVYLFDWDGTLAQTMEVWIAAVRRALSAYDIELNDYRIAHDFVGRLSQGAEEYDIPPKSIGTFKDEVRAIGLKNMQGVSMYPQAKAMLELLHGKGKRLALITTSRRYLIEGVIARHKLDDTFEVVVAGDDVDNHKPHPESVLLALEKLGVGKNEVVMVGDSEKDLAAASNAGIDSILFYPPNHQAFYELEYIQKHKPTITISSWQELIDKLG